VKRREQALRLKVYGRVQSIGRSVVFLHREGKSSQSLESSPELMRQLESVAAMEGELDEVRGQLDRLRPRPLQRSE
jgi:hypothetical protein